MQIQQYIDKKKYIQNLILEYIEPDCQKEKLYIKIIQNLKEEQVFEDKFEFNIILSIISSIANNHYRTIDFFPKIEQILLYMKDHIQKQFTSLEIIEIFKFNKRIILFLFEEKIIIPDQLIANKMIMSNFDNNIYFFNEFSSFIDQNSIEVIKFRTEKHGIDLNDKISIETKRKNGENDSYICSLIRNDSTIEFISYINRSNIRPSSTINISIFETNPFLIKKGKISLINYAAFYGSIEIFRYLLFNNVELKSDLWSYAIHGKNPELIHLLEENNVILSVNTVLEESIKCYHNDIANYIINEKSNGNENDFIFELSLINHNYELLQFNIEKEKELYFFYKYHYFNIVKILLEDKDIDVNARLLFYNHIIYSKIFMKLHILKIHTTLLCFAAKNNEIEFVKFLLENPNIDINKTSILISIFKFNFCNINLANEISIIILLFIKFFFYNF